MSHARRARIGGSHKNGKMIRKVAKEEYEL
jgi:hypothetical protein